MPRKKKDTGITAYFDDEPQKKAKKTETNAKKSTKKRIKKDKDRENEIFTEVLKGYDNNASILDNDLLEMDVIATEREMAEALQTTSPRELKKRTNALLQERRSQIAAVVDSRKLNQSLEVVKTMESVMSLMNDNELWNRVRDNVNTAKDMKMLSEYFFMQLKALQMLSRLDTVDGAGTPKRLNIGVQYKGADGSQTSVIVQSGE